MSSIRIKTFPLKLTIAFHRKIKESAKRQHISINELIMTAISNSLEGEIKDEL